MTRKTLARLAPRFALLAAAAACVGAGARTTSGELLVGATVRAVARVEQESAPADLPISPADVAVGYVDAASPVALTVSSNSPQGFSVDVLPTLPIADSIEIRGMASPVALGAEGGTLIERWRHPQVRHLSLQVRFVLAHDVSPGLYPWPLQLAVHPLSTPQ
ncbi:MAG: hypothetical protein KGL34_06565 [Gammaproteobacteria bacterium]|nr:hypothetical protein [Gammaproteobacteria bacterium]